MPTGKAKQAQFQNALALAAERFRSGDTAGAELACKQALRLKPRSPEALHLHGLIAHRAGDLETAARCLRRAVAARPAAAVLHNSLGVILRELGQADAAREALYRALKLRPRFPGACYNLGLVEEDLGDAVAALGAYETACGLDPDMAKAHHARGLVLQSLGRFEEARAAYRRALALRPDYAEAHFHLAHARRAESRDDPQLAEVQSLLTGRDWSPREAGWLLAAVGKLSDDAGLHDEAFRAYREGNELTGLNYDPDAADVRAGELVRAFDARLMAAPPDCALTRADRIYIVGMPRSGSTLLEALLATHPEIRAGGERPEIPALMAELRSLAEGAGWARADAGALKRAAMALDRALSPANGVMLTDKLPDNVWHLGFLGRLVPGAPVLIARRDPRDVGLSCFFTRFEQPHAFGTDLYHSGRRIRTVRRLEEHWLKVLPNPVMVVDYETLVDDPAAMMSRVFRFCGLDPGVASLDHASRSGAVNTASNWQVRQGIHRGSVNRWRHYRRHLGPLLEGLGPYAPAGG